MRCPTYVGLDVSKNCRQFVSWTTPVADCGVASAPPIQNRSLCGQLLAAEGFAEELHLGSKRPVWFAVFLRGAQRDRV